MHKNLKTIFFIVIITNIVSGDHVLNSEFGKIKIILDHNKSHNIVVNDYDNMNLTIISKNNCPFHTHIYTPEGKVKEFKGNRIEYLKSLTCLEVKNICGDIEQKSNIIKIYTNKINVEDIKIDFFYDYMDRAFAIISISTMMSITFYGTTNSKITKMLVVILLLIEILSKGYLYVGERFRMNVLRIK